MLGSEWLLQIHCFDTAFTPVGCQLPLQPLSFPKFITKLELHDFHEIVLGRVPLKMKKLFRETTSRPRGTWTISCLCVCGAHFQPSQLRITFQFFISSRWESDSSYLSHMTKDISTQGSSKVEKKILELKKCSIWNKNSLDGLKGRNGDNRGEMQRDNNKNYPIEEQRDKRCPLEISKLQRPVRRYQRAHYIYNWNPRRKEEKRNEEEKVFEEIIFKIYSYLLEDINYIPKKLSKPQASLSWRMR